MHITYKGDYALKTILDLAVHYGNGPVTINYLAKRADIPVKFLEQILLDLKRGGFVQSRRGKIGGYFLAKEPVRIRLGDVIRFIDGPIEPVGCVAKNYKGCKDINNCVLRGVWKKIFNATCGVVDNITFEDLAKDAKKTQTTFTYQI